MKGVRLKLGPDYEHQLELFWAHDNIWLPYPWLAWVPYVEWSWRTLERVLNARRLGGPCAVTMSEM